MGDFLEKLKKKNDQFIEEAKDDDHYLTGVNWESVKEECCQLEVTSKYNKKYKIHGALDESGIENLKQNLLDVTGI